MDCSSAPLRENIRNMRKIQLILKHCNGTDINKTDKYGTTKNTTALVYASIHGYYEIAQLLLQAEGIDINKPDIWGGTPLYYASRCGHVDIVNLLLQKSDININKEYKGAVTEDLCQNSRRQKFPFKENLGQTSLWAAIKNNNTDIVQLLLEHPKTDIANGIVTHINVKVYGQGNSDMGTAGHFLVASLLGNQSQVIRLLQSNFRILNTQDSLHRTPLFWASTRNHTKVVEHLLSHAQILVNIRSTGGATALFQASKYGLQEIVHLILQHPTIDVNIATLDKKTPLMEASQNGNSAAVKMLLAVPQINVNYATFDGKTALFYAVSAKHQYVLELLLRCPQTDISLMDEEYKTARNRAEEAQHTASIRLFKSRGNLQITKGHTCCSKSINRGLHVAVENEDLMWIKTFLECPQIEINIRNKYGYTPLNLAIHGGLKEIVTLFLNDRRIDVNKLNTGRRQSAFHIASEGRHIDILRLLLLHPQTFTNQKTANGESALSTAIQRYGIWEDGGHKLSMGTRLNFRIVKLLMKCPKIEVSNGSFHGIYFDNFDLEKTQQQELFTLRDLSLSKELKRTCCLEVVKGLMNASWVGDFRAIRGLLQCPETESKVNTVDEKGRTPLYIASLMGHLQVVAVLLDNKHVNTNLSLRIDGGTPFSIASEKAHFKVMRALIQHGQSDANKGWLNDNWVHNLQLFTEVHEALSVSSSPSTKPRAGKYNYLLL